MTAPACTLIDFAATSSREEAERAIAEAFALKLVTQPQIRAAVDRAPTRAGVARVRGILGQEGGPSHTRSGGERAMLRLLRAARLAVPQTNHVVAGFTADFLWPDQRLIVELDGYPFHGHRGAFERDHRRDVVHRDAGYEVLRFTGRQLEQEPLYVLAVIAPPSTADAPAGAADSIRADARPAHQRRRNRGRRPPGPPPRPARAGRR